MRTRSVLAASAALALVAGAATGPVFAAVGDPADGPAAGAASSTLTLLDLAIGGTDLSVLELALRSDTLAGSPATSLVVTPLTADGTAYGRQSLASRSGVLPAVDTRSLAPAAVSALAAVRTPGVDVTSEGGSSRAGTASLGAVSVLGLPLSLQGTASIDSVVDGTGAAGGKTVTVTQLALPSVADLLGALGLDLTSLPTGSLTDLLAGLDLDTAATAAGVAALEQALAPVQPQLDAADALLADATDAVRQSTAELEAATAALAPTVAALNDATRALSGTSAGLRVGSLIGALPGVGGTVTEVVTAPLPVLPVTPVVEPVLGSIPAPAVDLVDEVVTVVDAPVSVVDSALEGVSDAATPVLTPVAPVVEALLPLPELPLTVPPALQPLVDVYDATRAAYAGALADVTDAQALLDAAITLLADAQAAVDRLLAPYADQVAAVVDAVVGVLDATPLVSLDRLEVTTRSAVTSAALGGQSAEIVGGEVEGLRVLGTDVLQQAVGSSQVEVLDLTTAVTGAVDGVIGGLTGTLSDVLSQVPGLPGLEVPAPTVELLSRATVTDVADGFGVAGSALRALDVSWPGLSVPALAAVPGAAALPSVTGLPALPGALRIAAVGDVLSQPLSIGIATLEDRARFRPALLSAAPGAAAPGAGAPGTGTPGTGTPGTGAPGTGTPGTGTPRSGTPAAGTPTAGTPGTGTPGTTPVGLSQLPRTGLNGEPSLVALLLVGGALALHRRCRSV